MHYSCSFEQFCINYCNEKIQQFFIDSVLRTEQEVYVSEGLEWETVKFTSNESTCRMIEVYTIANIMVKSGVTAIQMLHKGAHIS
jgi:myosin heavy subunit